MAGYLTRMGIIPKNPFFNALSENRGLVSHLGRSLVGATDISDFAQRASNVDGGVSEAAQRDFARYEEAKKRKEEEARRLADIQEANRKRDFAIDWVRSRGENPDSERLLTGIQHGFIEPSEAFKPQSQQSEKFDQYGFSQTGSDSQQMKALLAQGIDEQTALGIVSGRYKVHTDPSTGRTSMIDMAAQKLVPLQLSIDQQQRVDQTAPQPATDQSTEQVAKNGLYNMAGDATGIGATFWEVLGNTLGQVPGPIGDAATNPQQMRASQEFNLFKRDLIRSLSLNPRFPVAEQQRIENTVPTGPFVSGEKLRVNLAVLDQEMQRMEAELVQALSDPNQPLDQRQLDQQSLRAIRTARKRIGVPQGGPDLNLPPGAAGSGVEDLKQKYNLE